MGSAADIIASPTFWLGMLILVVLFVLGYGVVAWTRRWMQENRSQERNIEDELERYRELRDSGEISEKEFQQITEMLHQQDAPPATAEDAREQMPPEKE